MGEIYFGLSEVMQALKEKHRCVFLYSGGLDGTHFLSEVSRLLPCTRVLPVIVDLGSGASLDSAVQIARKLTGDCIVFDGVEEFLSDFVKPAIICNGNYDSEYPLSASLSRPCLAGIAIRIANEREVDMVVHTSTAMQNSSVRLTKALRLLNSNISVGMPSYFDDPPRETKLDQVRELMPWKGSSSLSSDSNIWCSEVESLPGIDPECSVDIHPYLGITGLEQGSRTIQLRFESGIPVELEGERQDLAKLIHNLNEIGKDHGIGYYSWLEATPLGGKRLETRLCPAAAILFKAHKMAESGTLTENELNVKRTLDNEWVRLASRGDWYSPLKLAIESFASSLSSRVSARIELQLQNGSISLLSVTSENHSYLRMRDEESLSQVLRGAGPAAYRELFARLLFGDPRTGQY
jgi:argininosuccinate synthase